MALSSSKNLPALMPSKAKSGTALVNEKIDERILRLLGLEDVFDIDYDTYSSLLRERMAAARMAKQSLATEETELITNEWKRIKGKKGRFKVKKITAASFKKGSAVGINLNKQKKLAGIKQLALPPATDKMTGKSDVQEIIDALGEIIKSLTLQNKNQKNADDKGRKSGEAEKRGLAESALEKGFKGAIKVAEKIIAPVKSLLSRIIDFFTAIFLGRVVIKLLEWFSDPKNADKIKAIGKFFGDHWPKLLSLYIMFGTQFGGFVRGLISLLVKGGATLLKVALGLAAKAGIGKAGKFASFLGGKKGKLLVAGVEAATTVGATMALSSGIENFGGLGGEEAPPKVQGRAGGGSIRIPKFAGGGLNFGGFGNMFSGLVSGQKGVDKIPAMLSDGEFVMSRGAVQKYGVDTLEGMNAAGGGTNKPRMVSGATYAAGGGLVASKQKEKELKGEEKAGLKPTFGPGATPNMSTQEDMNKLANKIRFEERLKRVEAQVQSQKALASGKGVNIRGAELGTQIGKGFGATYKGRDSIVVPNAAMTGWEKEITLGGKRYFGQVKGKDVIYTSNFAKGLAGQIDKYGTANKSYKGKGGGLMGGPNKIDPKSLPKTQAMTGPDGKVFVGHLRFRGGKPEYARPQQRQKGLMENIGDFFNPGGAKKREDDLNSKSKREAAMNSLQYYRASGMTGENIAKQMKKLGLNLTQAQNDLKYKKNGGRRGEEIRQTRAAGMGNYSAANIKLAQNSQNSKKAKISANQKKLSAPTAPVAPQIKVKSTSSASGGKATPKSSGGTPRTPNFGATCPSSNAPKNKKILGIF